MDGHICSFLSNNMFNMIIRPGTIKMLQKQNVMFFHIPDLSQQVCKPSIKYNTLPLRSWSPILKKNKTLTMVKVVHFKTSGPQTHSFQDMDILQNTIMHENHKNHSERVSLKKIINCLLYAYVPKITLNQTKTSNRITSCEIHMHICHQ